MTRKMSDRQHAQRKRERAIKMLRDTGMNDAEIETELGEPITGDESEPIIEAEIVDETDLSKDEAIEDGPRHLPAVIPKPPPDSNEKVGRDWSKSAVPERRCVRVKLNGEQCKNAAIKGSTVCRYHGGAAKHVQAAARARLENATDRLAKELLGMAIDPDVAESVKLRAIESALDRGGLKAPNEVVVSAGAQSGFDEVFDGIYSGPRSGYVDTQRESIGIGDHQPPTAPVDDTREPSEPVSRGYGEPDYTGPAAPQADEQRERRQTQRPARPNRYAALTDEQALDLVNTENARNRADPPPPRPMRALPPGRY